MATTKVVIKTERNEVSLLKQQIARVKRESNAKEAALNGVEDEVEYKNRQLASEEVDIESYKRIADEKIFQLEAGVKELEAKIGGPSLTA